MAILLIHLRRILLLVTVVYLVGALVRKLLYGKTAAILRSSRSVGGFLFAKRLHLQPWFYIYTFYLKSMPVLQLRNITTANQTIVRQKIYSTALDSPIAGTIHLAKRKFKRKPSTCLIEVTISRPNLQRRPGSVR
ncbi:uncharacterized protein LOC121593316 isoform X2 [Anopheles merus]|uniref:uncharacterized protein LOC121593316 isoform X2 n=1 Tax=Anopheles merus TaxID=30066 RepID=UPI001BE44CF4|nr:uncharacterized protein LOC121593316 isoform X2 [Anopheles merus]